MKIHNPMFGRLSLQKRSGFRIKQRLIGQLKDIKLTQQSKFESISVKSLLGINNSSCDRN